MPAMPTRLAMKFGVSLARTHRLAERGGDEGLELVEHFGSVVGVAISSTSAM
jgi:hypothetical protein